MREFFPSPAIYSFIKTQSGFDLQTSLLAPPSQLATKATTLDEFRRLFFFPFAKKSDRNRLQTRERQKKDVDRCLSEMLASQ